jgi:hypothetical protein
MGFEPVDTLDDVPNIQKSVMFRFISQLFKAKNVLCFQHALNFSNYQLLNAMKHISVNDGLCEGKNVTMNENSKQKCKEKMTVYYLIYCIGNRSTVLKG